MVDVVFNFNQIITVIQANLEDKFQVIIDKFIQKSLISPDIVYFITNGKIVNPQKTIESHMNEFNKQNKKIIVLVNSIAQDNKEQQQVIIQSKDIICPNCKESCRFSIKNGHIRLSDCINNHTEYIKYFDFYKTQEINLSEIICHICKIKNLGNTKNGDFISV